MFFYDGGAASTRVRDIDWTKTSLGDPGGWPFSLQSHLATLFRSLRPTLLFWGDDYICFHNDALVPAGRRSPLGMALHSSIRCEETWRMFGDHLERVRRDGKGVRALDDRAPIIEGQTADEKYWTYEFAPAYAEDGKIGGVWVFCTETTAYILGARLLRESEQKLREALQQRDHLCRRLHSKNEQLTLALDSARMGTWHIDLRKGTLVVSEQLAMILGRGWRNEPISIHEPIIYPQDLARLSQAWDEAVHRHTTLTCEYRVQRPDGDLRWVQSMGRAAYDHTGAATSVSGVTLDVTERKDAEFRVQEQEKRIRTLAESIPQLAFLADDQGRVEYVNTKYLEYLSRPSEHVRGKFWLDDEWLCEMDRQATGALWEQSLKKGQPFHAEFRLRRHDGETRWHLGRATPILDETTRVVQWCGSITDVHDQKMHEEELLVAKEQAENASTSKSAFLANMSHEIRTPLGAILGFAELLRDGRSEAERQEYAGIIQRNGKMLTKIIDDILDLSKVEAGRLEFERITFDLRELLTEVLEMFEDRAKRAGNVLRAEIQPEVPSFVVSDPMRMRQILVNLVGNALKFTDHGSVILRVKVLPDRSLLKFDVIDTGVGMNDEQARRLFAPFTQGDGSTPRKFGGTGLGLMLSRRLARAMGGDVILESYSPVGGCTFSLTVQAPSAAKMESSGREPSDLSLNEVADWMKERRANVLLVEDSADNQTLVSLLLRKAGVHVDIANNGAEGIEKASQGPYDVILMDMQMPVLDGYEATERLRARGYSKPIVALTAQAMGEERQRILEAGCDAHLAKPLDTALLLRTIQSFIPTVH